jgi:hypothetical protein
MSAIDQSFWSLRYRRVADAVHREIGGEHLLIPIRGNLADLHSIFSLNAVAAAIWEKLDGIRDMDTVREELRSEYDVSEETLETDVREVVNRLADAGLLENLP